MNYKLSIEKIYEYLENDNVEKALMLCLRISRHLHDYLYTAIFLRETEPIKREFSRILYEDTKHLVKETQKFLYEQSLEYWLDTHQLDFSFGTNEDEEEKNILDINVGEIEFELKELKSRIQDLSIPEGMSEYDTAAYADAYLNIKNQIRLRIKAIQIIKQRIKTRCLNYAILIEKQLEAQNKSQNFLDKVYLEVNNYFKVYSKDLYLKLQKASQLIDSNNPEDFALLLTEVRRALKSAADYFYPAQETLVVCQDGKRRNLGDDKYMNRLYEYIATNFTSSTAKDLLKAEYEYLNVFVNKLNAIASKGVHDNVTLQEAKQGLLGLYMFLYNIISRLQKKNN